MRGEEVTLTTLVPQVEARVSDGERLAVESQLSRENVPPMEVPASLEGLRPVQSHVSRKRPLLEAAVVLHEVPCVEARPAEEEARRQPSPGAESRLSHLSSRELETAASPVRTARRLETSPGCWQTRGRLDAPRTSRAYRAAQAVPVRLVR